MIIIYSHHSHDESNDNHFIVICGCFPYGLQSPFWLVKSHQNPWNPMKKQKFIWLVIILVGEIPSTLYQNPMKKNDLKRMTSMAVHLRCALFVSAKPSRCSGGGLAWKDWKRIKKYKTTSRLYMTIWYYMTSHDWIAPYQNQR